MRVTLAILLFLSNVMASKSQQIDTGNLTPVLIPCTPVKDQYLSGTCWSFAGNSFLESELLKKGIKEIDLSEMFIAKNAWEQKAMLHVQYQGQNHLTPGGQFHNMVWAIKKYGLLTEEVYTGKTYGALNHNHGNLDTALTRYITSIANQQKTALSSTDWQYIQQTLHTYLGKSPASFTFKGKSYTPTSFLSSLPLQLDDYIEITSYTHHPFYQPFVLENKYNYSYDKYMNVPLVDFVAITDSALAKGYTVLWNGDVTDEGFNFYKGIALLYDVMDVAKERQQSFEDSTSYMDHMMHIVGYAKDKEGRKWYYVKNSWGASNSLKGYLMMDENYFAIKTAAIVVNKNTIPTNILTKFKQ
jgi:bleomycin hydrolase